MTAIELKAKKMEIIEMLMKVDDEKIVTGIMAYISKTRSETPPCQYTVEEIKGRLAKAEDDIMNGVPGIAHNEAMKQIKDRVASWK